MGRRGKRRDLTQAEDGSVRNSEKSETLKSDDEEQIDQHIEQEQE